MPRLVKIILIAIPLVAVVTVFGFFYFSSDGEKIVVVENEDLQRTSEIEIVDNGQEIESREQRTEINEQETEISEQRSVSSDQEVDDAEQETESQSLPSDETESDFDIKNNLVNWGHTKTSSRSIDTIVVHSSYNALGGDEYDVDKLIDEYKEYNVSPHYLIDRKGSVYRLVEDKDIAWHAGVSEMPDGRKNANGFSIGVELINNKEDEYTKAEYNSLNNLIDYLSGKYKIKYILGHDEISPGRKTDPWNMDWDEVSK